MSGHEGSREAQATPGWEMAGARRERYVERMFDGIAGPYDRLNRVISLGRDRRWRALAVKMSEVTPGQRVVDAGCGTGDLALDFARAVGAEGRVVGLDLSAGMLEVASQKRSETPWLTLHRANASSTGLPDRWADVVSMGWVLRNVGDREEVYREVRRVLKPGGRFVCVDMSRPRNPVWRAGHWLYRHTALPVLAFACRADRQAYRYLANSTDRFPDGPTLGEELERAGFSSVHWRPLMCGALAIHVGTSS